MSNQKTIDSVPTALGLLAAALVAWGACPVPRLPTLTFAAMLWIALRYTALVCVTAAMVTALLDRSLDRRILRSAAAAAWFAPLAAFLAMRSLWAAVAGIVLAFAIVRLVPVSYSTARPSKISLFAFGLAFLVQIAIVVVFAGSAAAAALLAGACAAALNWMIRTYGWQVAPAPSKFRESRAAAFAVLLTLFALAPFLKPDLHDIANPAAAAAQGPSPEPAFAGVILWPDVPPLPMVAPPPRAWLRDPLQPARTDPTEIPFSGVYWVFRAPSLRPPPNSIVERGTPAERSFRSTDFRPLSMEARQNLGRFVEVSCCRAIQVAIRNEDTQPGTVWLDLFLADTSIALLPHQFLGRRPVERGRALLTFPMTRAFRNSRFDEIQIRYELDGTRARRSAKVAIERFIFVSR